MCSEGIAASWLAWEASAPVCQEPIAWVVATTSVKPPEHPRGRHRVAPEDHEGEQVDQHQRVAQRPVDVRPAPPQQAEQPERHDEVGVVVVVGEQQPEGVMRGQPAVERELGVDAQRVLERSGCRGRGPAPCPRRSGARFVTASYTQHSHTITSASSHQRVRAAPAAPRRGGDGARGSGERRVDRGDGRRQASILSARPMSDDPVRGPSAGCGARARPARRPRSRDRLEHPRAAPRRCAARSPPRSSRRRRAAAAPSPRPRRPLRRAAIDSGVARASQSRPQWLHSSVRHPRARARRSAEALSTP